MLPLSHLGRAAALSCKTIEKRAYLPPETLRPHEKVLSVHYLNSCSKDCLLRLWQGSEPDISYSMVVNGARWKHVQSSAQIFQAPVSVDAASLLIVTGRVPVHRLCEPELCCGMFFSPANSFVVCYLDCTFTSARKQCNET